MKKEKTMIRSLLAIVAVCIALASGQAQAAAMAGPNLADAKAWGMRFAEAIASGDPAAPERILRTVYSGSDAFKADQLLEPLKRFMRTAGTKEHIDLAEDLLRGTAVYVSTHYISTTGGEIFVRVRFHRWAEGWSVRDIEFNTDYDKIPWGK